MYDPESSRNIPAGGRPEDAEAHAILSRRFQEHADIEIAKGNRRQASEKIWGSVAHALKALAEQRGWQHGSHTPIRDVARQLGNELADADPIPKSIRDRVAEASDFVVPYDKATLLHQNFYNNEIDGEEIENANDKAKEFIQKLNAIRDKSPGRFTPRSPNDQRRLARLLGIELTGDAAEREKQLERLILLDQPSDVGFSPSFGYQIPRLDDGDNGPDAAAG